MSTKFTVGRQYGTIVKFAGLRYGNFSHNYFIVPDSTHLIKLGPLELNTQILKFNIIFNIINGKTGGVLVHRLNAPASNAGGILNNKMFNT